MEEIETKNGVVKNYARTLENEAREQIIKMAESPLGENAHIAIMPDAHAGRGCTIGTTMQITDKVCPNLVGVDIGCGVNLVETNIDFEDRLDELDQVIRERVPFGKEVKKLSCAFPFTLMRCWNKLPQDIQDRARHSYGTLGGGNHFIEAYKGGYISVHSGSRSIGLAVAQYYQELAIKSMEENRRKYVEETLPTIPEQERNKWFVENRSTSSINKELAYLVEEEMEDYLYDIDIMQFFAESNRAAILSTIIKAMGGEDIFSITSTHNYIEKETRILRKGAISAKKDELLVIPLNMRDGILICKGKGNEEWNCSAPHGAGRLYSRTQAKEKFTLEDFKKEMKGIYSTCISEETLDEAPFAYKDPVEILECIEPTVNVLKLLQPVYNFKAN